MQMLIDYYLQLNLLLVLVFMAWSFMHVARVFPAPATALRQLRVALVVLLALPVLTALATMGWQAFGKQSVLPGLLAVQADIAPALDGVGEALGREWTVFGAILTPLQVLVVLLVSGFILQLASAIRGWLALRKLIRRGIGYRQFRPVTIIISEQATTPFSTRALGRNHIVLPYALVESPANLRIVIRHELQHVRNGDLFWVLVMEVLTLFCFWNPVVYLWRNRFDCLQEYACDAAVTGRPHTGYRAYGRCLLAVASRQPPSRVFGSSFMAPRFRLLGCQDSQLKRRILMLEQKSGSRFRKLHRVVTGTGLTVVLLASGAGLLAASGIASGQDASDEPPTVLPIVTVPPQYPSRALEENIEGWVIMEIDIGEAGEVVASSVLDSCAFRGSEDCQDDYADIFDASALRAINRFRFDPQEPQARSGVHYVFTFCLNDDGECRERGKRTIAEVVGQ